jgi:hypothetical protein
MNVEILTRDIETLRATVEKDGENIPALTGARSNGEQISELVRTAEIHERRAKLKRHRRSRRLSSRNPAIARS